VGLRSHIYIEQQREVSCTAWVLYEEATVQERHLVKGRKVEHGRRREVGCWRKHLADKIIS
jgi:hypothetical protein